MEKRPWKDLTAQRAKGWRPDGGRVKKATGPVRPAVTGTSRGREGQHGEAASRSALGARSAGGCEASRRGSLRKLHKRLTATPYS